MRSLIIGFLVGLAVTAVIAADDQPLETDSIERDYSTELPRIPPTEPLDSIRKFRIADGFRIELVAHEPLITDPVAMAFDEAGRLFVVCMNGYSEHGTDDLGVVRLLEDTNGDGVFDRGSNYATGLSWPTAVACYDGGVFVGAAPDVFYVKDMDGDGVADKTELVVSGFGRQNVQGLMNSFRWGLDNRLHCSASVNGGKLEDAGGNEIATLRGHDFSIEPGTRAVEPISGGAQHGATFSRWGDRFVCSNSDHLQWVEFEYQYLRRNRLLNGFRSRRSIAVDGPSAEVFRASKVEPWRIVRTRLRVKQIVGGPVEGGGRASGYFTSASGVTAYLGDAFEGQYQDDEHVFVGDVGSNLVHVKQVITTGLNKKAIRATPAGTEFLASTDNWFRPVQFANGPDGSLYVIDMYREVIEHPLSLPPMIKKHLDLNSGRSRGRIYRIVPEDWRHRSRRLPSDANASELVEMLDHSNGWHRETAARLLVQQASLGDREAELIGRQLVTAIENRADPMARIRALYCLRSIGRMREPVLLRQLKDSDPQARRHALKIAESSGISTEALGAQLGSMVSDVDLDVRYQLALTLGAFDWKVRGDALVALAVRDGRERKMRFAVLSSMAEERVAMMKALLALDAFSGAEELLNEIAFQIGQNRKRVSDAVTILNASDDARSDRFMAKLMIGIGRRGAPLIRAMEAMGVDGAANTVSRLAERGRQRALDSTLAESERLFALQVASLNGFESLQPALRELLAPQESGVIRDAVVATVGQFAEPDASMFLIESLPSLTASARRRAVSSLIARSSSARQLLDALEQESFGVELLSAQHRQSLRRHRDSSVARRAMSVLGDAVSRDQVIDQYSQVLNASGNVQEGKSAFRKSCAACHQLEGYGANVGPDLQPLLNRGAQFMLTNILDPNREIDPRYEAYNIVSVDGQTYTGIVSNDVAGSTTLLQADGKTITLDKRDIDSMSATGRSLMPEGLEKDLQEQGLADLIAYLIQLDNPGTLDPKP